MPCEPVLFVAAHPDDEVLGGGSQLVREAPPLVVHVTDGAPRDLADARALGFLTREAYAEARRIEARDALAPVGIGPERIVPLGVVDQEAALALGSLTRRLAQMFERLQPRTLFTHAYEGGHPDHDATAFAVHAACALVYRQHGDGALPAVFEFTGYHAAPHGGVRTGLFLAPNRAAIPSSAEDGDVTIELSRVARGVKERMLAAFRTQARVIAGFPVGVEHYRRAPRYRFTVAPHPPPLHYERLDWGWTAMRWRGLVTAALEELGLPDGEPL